MLFRCWFDAVKEHPGMLRLSLRSAHAGQDGQQDTQYKRDTQGQSRAQKVAMAGPIFV